jgi:hypothetical protein
MENFLHRQGPRYVKIVKTKRSSSAKVYFDDLADRRIAYERLSRTEVGDRPHLSRG